MTFPDLLQGYPLLTIALTFFFSLMVGSFLNVVIYRLPVMMQRDWEAQCAELRGETQPSQPDFNLIRPASHCPHCNHRIRPWENIPLLSYLLQKGRCRACGEPISARYPVIELSCAILSAVVIWRLGATPQGLAGVFLTWTLIALSAIDIDHQLLPDSITLPVLWLGLLLNLFGVFTDATASLIGAMAGYLSLWLIFHLFKLLTGKEGMGYGDFKLFALFGAWLGWQALPQIILLSSLVGAATGIAMILFLGRDRQLPIPFGPYLAAAGWIALLWGDDITRAYLAWANPAL